MWVETSTLLHRESGVAPPGPEINQQALQLTAYSFNDQLWFIITAFRQVTQLVFSVTFFITCISVLLPSCTVTFTWPTCVWFCPCTWLDSWSIQILGRGLFNKDQSIMFPSFVSLCCQALVGWIKLSVAFLSRLFFFHIWHIMTVCYKSYSTDISLERKRFFRVWGAFF